MCPIRDEPVAERAPCNSDLYRFSNACPGTHDALSAGREFLGDDRLIDLAQYLVPHSQVATRIVDGTAIIVLASSGEVQILNQVGTRIWELAGDNQSLQQIVDAIQTEYDVSAEQARQDVQSFVQSLVDSQVLTLADRPAQKE